MPTPSSSPNGSEELRRRLDALRSKTPTPSVPAAPSGTNLPVIRSNPFASIAARKRSTSAISGTLGATLLRPNGKTGVWSVGREKHPLPGGYHVVIDDTVEGWRLWEGNRVVEWVGERPDGSLPDRSELGHLDKSKWVIKFGEPDDPWEHVIMAHAVGMDPPFTGEEFTMVCSAESARNAITDLFTKIAARQEVEPGAYPVVALGAVERIGNNGPYMAPTFTITGWESRGAAMPFEPGPAPGPAPGPVPATAAATAQSPLPGPDDPGNDNVPWC